jgi:PilZ domain
MSWSKRKAGRVVFQHEHSVNLTAVDGTWRRACLLKDVSDSGARLEVKGSTDVLQAREFFLILSSTGLAFRRCQLVWINGSVVGVHFVSNSGKKKPAPAS